MKTLAIAPEYDPLGIGPPRIPPQPETLYAFGPVSIYMFPAIGVIVLSLLSIFFYLKRHNRMGKIAGIANALFIASFIGMAVLAVVIFATWVQYWGISFYIDDQSTTRWLLIQTISVAFLIFGFVNIPLYVCNLVSYLHLKQSKEALGFVYILPLLFSVASIAVIVFVSIFSYSSGVHMNFVH